MCVVCKRFHSAETNFVILREKCNGKRIHVVCLSIGQRMPNCQRKVGGCKRNVVESRDMSIIFYIVVSDRM